MFEPALSSEAAWILARPTCHGQHHRPFQETRFFGQMLRTNRYSERMWLGENERSKFDLEGISEKQRWPEEMSLEFRILYADCIYFHLSEIGNFKSSQCWMKWHVSHFPLLWQVANWAFSFLIDSLFSFPCWIPLKVSIYSNNSVMPCAAGPSPGYMGGCGMGGLGMAQMPPPSSMGAALGYVCHCVHAVHWSLDHQYLMNLRGKGNSKTPPFEGWSGWPSKTLFVLCWD